MPAAYINTHLILESRGGLERVCAGLSQIGLVCEITSDGRAVFETARLFPSPEITLTALLSALEKLTGDAYQEWVRCYRREFEVRYQVEGDEILLSTAIGNAPLNRIATAGATLCISIAGVVGAGDPP